jgi:hypothetical protein
MTCNTISPARSLVRTLVREDSWTGASNHLTRSEKVSAEGLVVQLQQHVLMVRDLAFDQGPTIVPHTPS